MPPPVGIPAGCSVNMSSNSRNLKSPFLITRCLYQWDRSASWSANMSSDIRNLKSPFLTTGRIYWGVNLPVDQPIWAPRVEISFHYSWLQLMPLPVGVDLPDDLPVDLPIWALTVEISSHHSWPLDVSTSGSWSANMSSNSRNLKLPFLTTRCLYWGDRSAS